VPVVGKMVSQNASPSPEPPTDLPPPIDNGSLGEGLPSWTAAASVPSTSLPVGTEYWNNVTQGLASQDAEQKSARRKLEKTEKKASGGKNPHANRQLYEFLVAGVVVVLLVGVLISGGLFLAGGLLLGTSGSEPEQISDRAKANRKELKNGIDRAAQFLSGAPPIPNRSDQESRVSSTGETSSESQPSSGVSPTGKTVRIPVQMGMVIITDNGYLEINQVRIECNNGNVLTSQWRRNAANKFGYDLEEPTVTETTNRMAVIFAIRGAVANYLNGKYD